jgi:hypothetical protein
LPNCAAARIEIKNPAAFRLKNARTAAGSELKIEPALYVRGAGESHGRAKNDTSSFRARPGNAFKFHDIPSVIGLLAFANAATQVERTDVAVNGRGFSIGSSKPFHDTGQRDGLATMATHNTSIVLNIRLLCCDHFQQPRSFFGVGFRLGIFILQPGNEGV